MSSVPLKRICSRPPEYGLNITPDRYRDGGVRLLRTSDLAADGQLDPDGGVYLNEDDVPAQMILEDGDLLFSRSGTVGRAFLYDRARHGRATFAGFLVRFRLDDQIDPRAVRYWSESAPFVAGIESGAVQSTIMNFNAERYASLEVPATVVQHSHRVADYLDDETARIDALMQARRRMAALVLARLDGRITEDLEGSDWRVVPLKWRTRLTVGIVIRPSELYAESGVPCLRGFNVRAGAVNGDDLVYISEAANQANAKSILRAGDVVVVRTGNAGAAAVVPSWAVGGNCVDLLIVRRSPHFEPRFLEAVLNSAVISRQIEEKSVGALQAHFNTESLANLRVPVPGLEEQGAVVGRIDRAREEASAMKAALECQIDLLLERRQALITAAVTGDRPIPGIAA